MAAKTPRQAQQPDAQSAIWWVTESSLLGNKFTFGKGWKSVAQAIYFWLLTWLTRG